MKIFRILFFLILSLSLLINFASADEPIEKGASLIIYEADSENPTDDELKTAEEMIRQRLDNLGYYNALVFKTGEKAMKIIIPFTSVSEDTIKLLSSVAELKFVDYEGVELLNGTDIKKVSPLINFDSGMGQTGNAIEVQFTEDGANKFSEATKKASTLPEGQNYIGIIFDDQVISMPRVQEQITAPVCVITGAFTEESARTLSALLNSGNPPFSLTCTENRVIHSVTDLGVNSNLWSVQTGIVTYLIHNISLSF